jgi:uncharacterized membrane protein
MPSDEDIARAFHDAYERLAPSFGYSTRTSSAKPWAMVPAANKALMIATVGEVRALLGAATTPTANAELKVAAEPPDAHTPFCDGSCKAGTHQCPTPRPAEVCSKCGTALALHLPRWLGIAPVVPDYETHCTCGRALPCRHCPEETT